MKISNAHIRSLIFSQKIALAWRGRGEGGDVLQALKNTHIGHSIS
jgi:hypothetical protein